MSVTVTLHLWWVVAYLAIGVVTWLPLEWIAQRHIISSPGGTSFWGRLRWSLRGGGRNRWTDTVLRVLLPVVAWPLAVWEATPISWRRRIRD